MTAAAAAFTRPAQLERLRARRKPWDIVVIGGGATGAGIALDAAARGYSVALLERYDFGKGTSSRSTKLVHGGVRYLEEGDIALVREALRERGLLFQNAPHLVHELPFILPCRKWWERPFYGFGLWIYQLLSGRRRIGSTLRLSVADTLAAIPTLRSDRLRGSVLYADGQFDDTRLLIHLLMTAVEQGAAVSNYCEVTGLLKDDMGTVTGVVARELESGDELRLAAKVVVNATGVFCDGIRQMAQQGLPPMVAPSQGVHLVFARRFLPGSHALIVPHTDDGRVLFAIPWHGHTLVGTTDVARPDAPPEPLATDAEVSFILETAGRYLIPAPTRDDVLSVYVGIRPLVRVAKTKSTAKLSRDHSIHIDQPGLLTITGGKWTTYRNMAEDAVDQAAKLAGLPSRPCTTTTLPIHGSDRKRPVEDPLHVYGSDAEAVLQLAASDPKLAKQLHAELPCLAAEVVWAARHEMAGSVEDVLARRTRALFLNARAAVAMAPAVASLLAAELGHDAAWAAEQVKAFKSVARQYVIGPSPQR